MTTAEDVQRVTKTTRYEVRLTHRPPVKATTFSTLGVAVHYVRAFYDCGPVQRVQVGNEFEIFSGRGQLLAVIEALK